MEAGKLAVNNDLTKALELLKRGLQIKPTHVFCRFNEGVILFKLGLIVEAAKDFEHLLSPLMLESLTKGDLASAAYNLAICHIQQGQYREAIERVNLTLKQ